MGVPDGVDRALWENDHVNEDHIAAFAQALSYDDNVIEGNESPTSPKSPPLGAPDFALPSRAGGGGSTASLKPAWNHGPDATGENERRVEKLTATSDFAPIHQRVRKRSKATAQGLGYHLLRWPLLFFIFLIITTEFYVYVLIRQLVNAWEYVWVWRGSMRKLRRELRGAATYDAWVEAAARMDKYLGLEEWKEIDEDSLYDYRLVKKVKRTLAKLRAQKDTRNLMDALAICVRSNFAGTESVKIYSETFIGTKHLVEEHIDEVAASLEYVRNATDVSLEEKRAFYRAINKNYGSSALCLSGGASFGYYHFGVVKAFLEADLLPRVITGTSAGGLVAAMLCTRTDDELKQLLRPELADKITACGDPLRVWVKRWWETGARFSAIEWARKSMFFTRGSLTFKEAYERTGRALNVSVVPSDRHSPTILLNHLTAPNCLIWSAIIASAAVPGILNPVVLMAKDRDGQIKPHNLGGSRFKDGSLREDIPLGSLHAQFNCNFSIVSQTNPHIHLFFFAPRGSVVAHRKGKGGFFLSALESYIKLDLSKHFKVIRDLDLLPQLLQSDWSGVFLQRFSGDLTLTPRSTLSDWSRILSDPTQPQLARMLRVGQRVTFPALHMVRNRSKIERAIFAGRTEVRRALDRERKANVGAADTSPSRGEGTPLDRVPLESDVDAGFEWRTRRVSLAPGDIFGLTNGGGGAVAGPVSGPSATQRRRRFRPRRRASEVLKTDSDSGLEMERRRAPPGSASAPRTPTTGHGLHPRSYTASLSETIRNVRDTYSPFRSIRGGRPEPEPVQGGGGGATYHSGSGGRLPKRSGSRSSRLSLTRWWGGNESSEDEEDATLDWRAGSPVDEGLGLFGSEGSALVDDEDEEALDVDDTEELVDSPPETVAAQVAPAAEGRTQRENV